MIDYEAEEVVKHIFSRLRCVYDRRKAALLAFLAQYKVGRRNVYELMCGGRPLARARFYIGCGVMSDEVYEALRSGGFERPPEEVCTYAACYRAYTHASARALLLGLGSSVATSSGRQAVRRVESVRQLELPKTCPLRRPPAVDEPLEVL